MGAEPGRFEFSEVHMGMPVRVVLYAPDAVQAERAARAAFARIKALDAVLSDYRPDSEVSRLPASAGAWTPVSADLFAVLARALDVARASGGGFDPTVGPLTALWREARRTGRAPDAQAIETARARVGWQMLALDPAQRAVRVARPDMRLDLGGIAKGYILQQGLTALESFDVTRALLDAGGDIVVGDAPPGKAGWRIDMPHADRTFAARSAALVRASLATSGATSQFVEIDGVRYSHVIDPRTGIGITHDVVTSVIAPDGATADALATAIGVLGPERARTMLAGFPGSIATVSGRATRFDQRPVEPQDAGSRRRTSTRRNSTGWLSDCSEIVPAPISFAPVRSSRPFAWASRSSICGSV